MPAPQQGQNKAGFTLEVRRTFPFSLDKVFAAWTDRKQLEQWMCKDAVHHVVIHRQQDIRTGGRYVLEVHDPDRNEVYWGQGTYREIKPLERIVFTWHWTQTTPNGGNLHPDSPETVVTVEFFARGNATEVVLRHGPFGSQADEQEHNGGWNGCLDVLAAVLQADSHA